MGGVIVKWHIFGRKLILRHPEVLQRRKEQAMWAASLGAVAALTLLAVMTY